MRPTPTYVSQEEGGGLTFSVCSLVRHQDKYDRLLDSFAKRGFTPDTTEFLAADNREQNQFDGYTWYRRLLAEARGKFVIFCHDDVELIKEGRDDLLQRLAQLDELDPAWLLAGIAGGKLDPSNKGKAGLALHISDLKRANRRRGDLPCRVETLDECFILMRRHRPVLPSYDLNGFHFYGPDLCLQAELAGGTAWAIDFHMWHHGLGTMGKPFDDCREAFILKYRRYFPNRRLRCTTGRIMLAKNASGDKGNAQNDNDHAPGDDDD